jgi:hypothetical protein
MKCLSYEDWLDKFEEALEDDCPENVNFEKWCKKQYEIFKRNHEEALAEDKMQSFGS